MTPQLSTTHEDWQRTFNDWHQSGMSIAAYCRDAEIPAWKFHYWKNKFLANSPQHPANFVQLALSDDDSDSSGLSIEIFTGNRLLIEKGFSREDLFNVLSVIRELKC